MATTEQLMAQYGVAWFGFDEASGNVYDKLGLNNYVGTVAGATRVQGWNGEGNSMSFNGTNQYVQFNDRIIPIGEKTIRFKIIKPSPSLKNIFGTAHTTASTHGDAVSIRDNGSIGWASLRATTGLYRFYLESNINICDNKWHDILLTWDGTTDEGAVKIYIDDMTNPNVIGTANIVETANPSTNLTIGRASGGSAHYYFDGQIDDLQVYNKALFPSDFTQKRLVVKSESNRSLILSPTSTRVKEIPNTEENTLLAQGGVIHEIDSAIDRPPIDLTRTSTEYEIISNNNEVLGDGKMFKQNIPNDFKKIVIEDNY